MITNLKFTMVKYNKILVDENNVVGDEIQSSNIVNLSSVPNSVLTTVLARIPKIPQKLSFMRINGLLMYEKHTKTLVNTAMSHKKVTVVVDDKDKHQHNKVKNLMKNMKFIMVTKISLIGNMDKTIVRKTSGYEQKVTNFHHRSSTMKMLGCDSINISKLNNYKHITIVQTNDDRASSIDGIILVCNTNKIPYNVEHYHTSYNESWLTTSRNIKSIRYQATDFVKDILPDNDNLWNYKTGYCDLIMTDNGLMKLDFPKINKQPKPSNVDNWIQWIIDKIRNMFMVVVTKIEQYIKRKDDKRTNSNVDKKTKNRKSSKPKLAFSTLSAVNLLNTVVGISASVQKKNASNDIKKANKYIARLQLSKILTKIGVSGDKTELNTKQSDMFNAYMASTMSYNVTEAITLANSMAAKDYRSNIRKHMVLTTCIAVTVLMYKKMIMRSIITLTLCAVGVYTNIIYIQIFIALLNILVFPNFLFFVIDLLALFVESVLNDDDTEVYRAILYFLIKCLLLL